MYEKKIKCIISSPDIIFSAINCLKHVCVRDVTNCKIKSGSIFIYTNQWQHQFHVTAKNSSYFHFQNSPASYEATAAVTTPEHLRNSPNV